MAAMAPAMALSRCPSSLQFHHHNSGRGSVRASISSDSNSNLVHFPRQSLQQQQLLLSKEEVDCSRHSKSLNELRRILCEVKDGVELMTAIDHVQKLDIGYHFTEEIEAATEFLFRNRREIIDGATDKLLQITSLFRLLRQARYPVSSDMLGRFLDDEGEFVAYLAEESVDGMISLHEASFLNTGAESLLYKANAFATHHLESSLPSLDPDFARFVRQTLDHPYHLTLQRFKATQYLSRHRGRHQDRWGWKTLLYEFASRNFLLIQSIHQMELKQVTCWWKNTGLAQELKLARDQSQKWYTWSMAILSNPRFSNYRIALAKAIAFVYLLDDIFDVYGSLDELHRFTQAINQWDITTAGPELPNYMRSSYAALLNTTNEIAKMVHREHGWDPTGSLKLSWRELCNAFLEEAKWFAGDRAPASAEYMRNGIVSCGVPLVLTHVFFLLGQGITQETVDVIESHPSLITCPATILRLWDDLGSAQDEGQEGRDGSYLQYYVNERMHCSIHDAREAAARMIAEAWEQLNKVSFSPGAFSQDFMTACLNLARMVGVMYNYDEKQKLPVLEEYVNSLLLENKYY